MRRVVELGTFVVPLDFDAVIDQPRVEEPSRSLVAWHIWWLSSHHRPGRVPEPRAELNVLAVPVAPLLPKPGADGGDRWRIDKRSCVPCTLPAQAARRFPHAVNELLHRIRPEVSAAGSPRLATVERLLGRYELLKFVESAC
jgi:hypothetical protein